jgi:pantetheine-phosphate adenylyltransferase
MKKRKTLYAGAFDPITNGHLDIIMRGAKISDELTVGVLNNLSKTPLFTVDERKELILAATGGIDNIVVDSFGGLMADYVKQGGFDVVIRGLRASMDFEYEIQMAQMNARLYGSSVETVFLMTNPAHSFLSSSIIKEVFSLGGNIQGLVPEAVLDGLKNKFKK